MKKIILMIMIFTSIAFTQNGKKFMYYLTGAEDEVYALNLDGGTNDNLYFFSDIEDFDIQGTANFRTQVGWLNTSADSVKAHFIFDSAYVANNLDSLGEDISSAGSDGTFYGQVEWVNDSPKLSGTSQKFDGDDYYVLPSLDMNTTDYSFECWVKIDPVTHSSGRAMLLSQHGGSVNGSMFVYLNGKGAVSFKISYNTSSTSIQSVGSIDDNKWHHLAFTFDSGTNIKIYIDGECVGTATTTITNVQTNQRFCIGAIEPEETIYGRYVGLINEVRLSKRLLTEQEIKNNYYRTSEIGFDDEWNSVGNHSIDTTTTAPNNGTFAGKIVSSGAGSSSANYVSIPIGETLEFGKKYMVTLFYKSAYLNADSISVILGDNTTKFISSATWARKTYHIKASSDITSLKLFLNKADTIFVDNIQIKRKYDYAILNWNKPMKTASQTLWRFGASSEPGYYFYYSSTALTMTLRDEYGTNVNASKTYAYNDTTWHFTAGIVNWTGNLSVYIDDQSAGTSTSHQTLGSLLKQSSVAVVGRVFCFNPGQNVFQGQGGELRLYRFDDISESDFNASTFYNSGKMLTVKGGGATLVAKYDWKGNSDEYTDDKSKDIYYNDLIPSAITIDDQVKVGTKYK